MLEQRWGRAVSRTRDQRRRTRLSSATQPLVVTSPASLPLRPSCITLTRTSPRRVTCPATRRTAATSTESRCPRRPRGGPKTVDAPPASSRFLLCTSYAHMMATSHRITITGDSWIWTTGKCLIRKYRFSQTIGQFMFSDRPIFWYLMLIFSWHNNYVKAEQWQHHKIETSRENRVGKVVRRHL